MYAPMDTKEHEPDRDPFTWVDWIIEQREQKGWSQSQLARKVKATRQTINDYEGRRRANPDEKILSRISVVFGFPDDYLPRLAGQLPPKSGEIDPWVEKMANKIAQLPPSLKSVAERIIDSMIEDEGRADTQPGGNPQDFEARC